MCFAAATYGQERKVRGTLIDRDSKEALTQTTVQLLKTDSTFVAGAISNEKGEFVITAPENSKYLLKISSVGYPTYFRKLEISADTDLNLGDESRCHHAERSYRYGSGGEGNGARRYLCV